MPSMVDTPANRSATQRAGDDLRALWAGRLRQALAAQSDPVSYTALARRATAVLVDQRVTQQQVSKLVAGQILPSLPVQVALARVLGFDSREALFPDADVWAALLGPDATSPDRADAS